MLKLILAILFFMITSATPISAEENTSGVIERIGELAEVKTDTQLAIEANINKLSEEELKKIVVNVNELTEQSEEDLVIKEAAIHRLDKLDVYVISSNDSSIDFAYKSDSLLTVVVNIIVVILFSALALITVTASSLEN